MPVGPITLADEVGVDVASHVRDFLAAADLGVRMQGGGAGNPMADLVASGALGKKAGRGFFKYETKKGRVRKAGVNPEAAALLAKFKARDLGLGADEAVDRLLGRFVNEAVFCLQDGVIENPLDGDVGAVFGCGFLPFTGGPFRMIDAVGADKYCDMLQGFADRYGPQFAPAPLLQDLAKSGAKFHK